MVTADIIDKKHVIEIYRHPICYVHKGTCSVAGTHACSVSKLTTSLALYMNCWLISLEVATGVTVTYPVVQWFPTWDTRTPRGKDQDIKGYAKKIA